MQLESSQFWKQTSKGGDNIRWRW